MRTRVNVNDRYCASNGVPSIRQRAGRGTMVKDRCRRVAFPARLWSRCPPSWRRQDVKKSRCSRVLCTGFLNTVTSNHPFHEQPGRSPFVVTHSTRHAGKGRRLYTLNRSLRASGSRCLKHSQAGRSRSQVYCPTGAQIHVPEAGRGLPGTEGCTLGLPTRW